MKQKREEEGRLGMGGWAELIRKKCRKQEGVSKEEKEEKKRQERNRKNEQVEKLYQTLTRHYI